VLTSQNLQIVFFVYSVHSVSIDNDLIGEPDIECMEQEIRVHIKTRKPFSGMFNFENLNCDAISKF
jgi:hypothetical protein